MLLREWLEREQIQRKDFAAKIRVSPSLVTALCNGSVWPGRDVANRIAEATNREVTADDFMEPPSGDPTAARQNGAAA